MWDMFLRGTVAGLLLFHLAHLAWPGPHGTVRIALSAFTLSVLAYLFCSMPGMYRQTAPWLSVPLLALCVSNAPLLWLAVRAVFDDAFSFTPPVIVLAALTMFLGLAVYGPSEYWSVTPPARQTLRLAHALTLLGFVAAALWEIGRGWRVDLVEPRRAARRWVALGIGAYAAIVLMVELALPGQAIVGLLTMLHIAGIGVVAIALAVIVARRPLDDLLGPIARIIPVVAAASRADAAPQPAAAPTVGNSKLLARLEQAMTEERAYRQEGLTLAALAGTLRVGEAALRGLINQGMGYRNFNDFLHHYRIEEATTHLAQDDLPILSIALECGYGSIGPFNRAFKIRMGMTPTEYRVAARMASGRGPASLLGAGAAEATTK